MLFRKCPNCDINHWFISQFGHLYSKKSPWLFYEESNIVVVRIQYEIGQAISSFKDRFSLFHSRLVVAKDVDHFIVMIGSGIWNLGIQVHPWGVRVMLVFWHICINF